MLKLHLAYFLITLWMAFDLLVIRQPHLHTRYRDRHYWMAVFSDYKACLCHLYTRSIYTFFMHLQGWTLFCLQNCINPLWHRFNLVPETFSEILVLKGFNWNGIGWLWRPLEYSVLIVMFKKPGDWDDCDFLKLSDYYPVLMSLCEL